MTMIKACRPSPWDTDVFGKACYEITDLSEDGLAGAVARPGHYTVKIDPLADKGPLHRHGFYYTDTLLEPVCRPGQLVSYPHSAVAIDKAVQLADVQNICSHAFAYGRFHRDFNLPREQADQRYVQWLGQMHAEGHVLGLLYEGELSGFVAFHMDADACASLLLHALNESFRGRGLAKFLWSAVCDYLFAQGASELKSSISAANLPVLNLYSSLGFRFTHAVDTYHCLSE
ncbi:MAG: GNAT family N-acetyltransferase [Mariprofundaceae bacterium]|nr:GNAT family N-acetyltransferase [Mariprofundaceae bacterium]